MRQVTLLQEVPRTVAGGFVPPLKWAGGKRWLVPHLKPIWSKFEERRLVEPFAGGLAVTLGLLPKRAVVNDINEHLVNFYQHLKDGLVLDIKGGTTDRTFKARRRRFNDLVRNGTAVGKGPNGRLAAQLFYYLNRHCYNGLCRFNKSGEFNTPNGRYVNPKFEKDLTAYRPILKNWDFTSVDFENVPLNKGDFVYADPPYDNAFTDYTSHDFGYNEQKRLAKWLAEHDGPVVISNHATDSMIKLYKDLEYDVSRRYNAPRMIHCFGDRTPAVEVVATRGL